ncbi:PIN domain-containing protein, partial [Acinetobacter pittii]|uniref:PIN domain-containing protein n=1 Tax=Acinetobacter pittii TaxID=48296 RepID=UPI003A4C58C1
MDAFTLLEINYFNKLSILDNLEKIYISNNTHKLLKSLLNKYELDINNPNIKGTMSFNNNSPIFIEHDIKQANEIYSDIKKILSYIETTPSCSIDSAYGDGNINSMDLIINNFLTTEENAFIRLSREKKIPLLSFDARLRAIANQLDILTINMDDFTIFFSPTSKNDFFVENKFIKSRTISESYLDNNKMQSFFIHDFKNFYNFLNVFFKQISETSID